MKILLELPFLMGLIITILTISIGGILIVFLFKRFIKKKMTKQHERIGRLLFRVTAGLIALLLSLSYANEKVRYIKILDSMEEEADSPEQSSPIKGPKFFEENPEDVTSVEQDRLLEES